MALASSLGSFIPSSKATLRLRSVSFGVQKSCCLHYVSRYYQIADIISSISQPHPISFVGSIEETQLLAVE